MPHSTDVASTPSEAERIACVETVSEKAITRGPSVMSAQ